MRIYNFILIVVLAVLMACTLKPSPDITDETQAVPTLLNAGDAWKLKSPQTGSTCEIFLTFSNNNKTHMIFRGEPFEGYYEFDSVLTHYITLNVFNKKGWVDECPVNPEYLTLYDGDTQFSYTILANKMYFQRAEKVIVFERVPYQNI